MHAHHIIDALFRLFIVFGFSYIIWTIAAKESSAIKILGQGISVAIVLLVLASALFMPRPHWKDMDKNMDAQMTKDAPSTVASQKTDGKWTTHGKHMRKHTAPSTDKTEAQ
jgi:hypothetical protein